MAGRPAAHWRDIVQDKLVRCGVTDDTAADLAHTVVDTLEGAEMSAQIQQSTTPLEHRQHPPRPTVAVLRLTRRERAYGERNLLASIPGPRHPLRCRCR